ncbi:hypothetical protein LZ30DRAFT_122079 [Colletotrichum cereale]|nr:hypothetical protein LZ30DRAFT_122079 [Colletotrichum cereale]
MRCCRHAQNLARFFPLASLGPQVPTPIRFPPPSNIAVISSPFPHVPPPKYQSDALCVMGNACTPFTTPSHPTAVPGNPSRLTTPLHLIQIGVLSWPGESVLAGFSPLYVLSSSFGLMIDGSAPSTKPKLKMLR